MYQLQAIGNLTRDAGIKNFNGSNFIEFSIAVNRKVRDQEYTDYIDCTLTADRGTIFPYLTKGKKIFIQGVPRLRAYISTQTNQPCAGMSVMVDRIELLSPAENAQRQNQPSSSPQTTQSPGQEGMPF